MPPLGKTGIRFPWLPGPLQGSIERVQPALVVMAIVPSVLLGGNVEQVGYLPRSEDVQRPARPAVVVQQPVPAPGVVVVQTYAPRDQPVVQPDHTWPVWQVAGQQPVPAASFWAPSPARLPNADPLRPPMVGADPPDSTLAQPSTLLIGRLPRDEDTSRPARPASVQTGAQPVPVAQALRIGIVHDAPVVAPDRLAQTQVVLGAQPLPGAAALLVGIVHDGDRLPLGAAVLAPQPPIPGARAQLIGGPRETPAFVVGAPIVLTLDARALLLHVATRDDILTPWARPGALTLASRPGVFSLRERSTALTIEAR